MGCTLGSNPASWHGGWGQQPRVQVLPLVPPQLFPAWLPEASAGVGDESEPGGEDEAWGPDVITTSLHSVVFSKCTFFGGRLGQRQRLVPVPHQCHQEGMGTKPFAVPKPKPLLLAMGGARAMNYPYLHLVGLGQGLAHSRAGISVHGTNEPVNTGTIAHVQSVGSRIARQSFCDPGQGTWPL